MRKIFKNQLFTFESGREVLIDVVVEDGTITEIIAAEQVDEFAIGDIINVNGDESLIRSEDIEIGFLEHCEINKDTFWNILNDANKNKAEKICEGYAGSDGTIGRIFELYTESDMELEPNEYVLAYFDSLED